MIINQKEPRRREEVQEAEDRQTPEAGAVVRSNLRLVESREVSDDLDELWENVPV